MGLERVEDTVIGHRLGGGDIDKRQDDGALKEVTVKAGRDPFSPWDLVVLFAGSLVAVLAPQPSLQPSQQHWKATRAIADAPFVCLVNVHV
jgi:hypothetical protein